MPVRIEGDERVAGQTTKPVSRTEGQHGVHPRPTAEDLAGVPICIEGREDLRVRRVVRRQNIMPATPGDTLTPGQAAQA